MVMRMLNCYTRYIMRQLLHSAGLVTLSLTSIVWLTQALRLMDVIVNQGVSLNIFLLLTLLMLPSLLLMILPVALFCAVMFTYYKLRQDSELIVLQSAGISRWRLARGALTVASGAMVLGYVIGFYLMPTTFTEFRNMQNFIRNNYASVMLQEGVFNTPIEGLTVFVRTRDADDMFHGILVHDSRQAGASVTMMAESGKLVQTHQGQRFLLTHGNRQEMREGKLSLLYFDSYGLDLSFYATAMAQRNTDVRELFFPALIRTEGLTASEIGDRRQELHQRLTWPLYAMTFTLVALAALVAGEYNRRGNTRRLVTAVLAVTAIAFSAVGLRNLVGTNAWFTFFAYLNVFIPAAIAAAIISDRLPRYAFPRLSLPLKRSMP